MEHLFVYGLLRRGLENPMAKRLAENAEWLGEGTVYGEMFDAGGYPAVVLREGSSERIRGDVYRLVTQDILKDLDEFEGIGPSFSQPFEYERKKVEVSVRKKILVCWIYEYQWPVEGKEKLIGNFPKV